MLEVHGAHAVLRTRFASHAEFRDGLIHVPETPGIGYALKD